MLNDFFIEKGMQYPHETPPLSYKASFLTDYGIFMTHYEFFDKQQGATLVV